MFFSLFLWDKLLLRNTVLTNDYYIVEGNELSLSIALIANPFWSYYMLMGTAWWNPYLWLNAFPWGDHPFPHRHKAEQFFSYWSVLWSWRDYVLKIWSSGFWQGGSSRVLLHLLYILTPVCFWWSGLGQQAPHPCFPFGTFLGVFWRCSFHVGPLGQLDAFHMNISVGDLRIPLPPSIFYITECFLTLAVQMNQLGSFKKMQMHWLQSRPVE